MKGTFGYIDKRKKKQLGKAIGMFLAAALVFIFGYLANKNSKANVFTVLAVLMVLPAAKLLVTYIVLSPYKSVSREKYDKVARINFDVGDLKTDFVITSSEKVMFLSFLIIAKGNIIGLIGREKEDASYIEAYLSRNMKNLGYKFDVKIFKDEKQFLKRAEAISWLEYELDEEKEKEWKETEAFIMSLAI